MDIAALGLPLEQVRDVWLIALMAYTILCLLVDIAYPVAIKADRAREIYLAVKGSPVDAARARAEELAAAGNPLTPGQKGAATKRAKKQLEQIPGAGVVAGWAHVLMYAWAWIVTVSIFTLYWDIAYDGLLIPALALPFSMVYVGARAGRRQWRTARGFSAEERALGTPRLYTATLGRWAAALRVRGDIPGVEPIRCDHGSYWVMYAVTALPVLNFLLSLSGFEGEDFSPMYVGYASFGLALSALILLVTGWVQLRSYALFNPNSFLLGRLLASAKEYSYSEIQAFRVIPNNPDAIKTDEKEPGQWKLEIMLPNGRERTFSLKDTRIDCLVAQIAFKLEQGR